MEKEGRVLITDRWEHIIIAIKSVEKCLKEVLNLLVYILTLGSWVLVPNLI